MWFMWFEGFSLNLVNPLNLWNHVLSGKKPSLFIKLPLGQTSCMRDEVGARTLLWCYVGIVGGLLIGTVLRQIPY